MPAQTEDTGYFETCPVAHPTHRGRASTPLRSRIAVAYPSELALRDPGRLARQLSDSQTCLSAPNPPTCRRPGLGDTFRPTFTNPSRTTELPPPTLCGDCVPDEGPSPHRGLSNRRVMNRRAQTGCKQNTDTGIGRLPGVSPTYP